MTFDNILVPIDFSASSIEALDLATKHFGNSTLYVFHAIHDENQDFLNANVKDKFLTKHQDEIHKKISSIIEKYRLSHAELEIAIGIGKPSKAILEAGEDYKADLIIMSSHGDTGISKSLFGHTTYQVSRKAHCSVWVIKGKSFQKRHGDK